MALQGGKGKILKLYAAKFWAQKHNDSRWTDCGYHYALTPWSYDTNIDDVQEGWLIEPSHSIEVEEHEIGDYHVEQSNVLEGEPIIKSGRDLVFRLERRRFQPHYSEQDRAV
ncbi:MAG: hypothetical protein EBR94_01145 [Bacteroidetes bacterium]|nr:hypothetical protein [Bacteroidota bacterium]